MKTRKFVKMFFLFLHIFISISVMNLSGVYAGDKKAELAESINQIISDVSCKISIQIASADKYDLLYEYQPDQKMIPASITKLITAAVAFKELGLSYDFKTIIYTDDSNINDGVVNGNIYLKGYGDPDLNSSDVSLLAKNISDKNITEITGNIIYDESFFDDEHYGIAGQYKDDTQKNYWPYISALNFNKNGGGLDPAANAAEYLSGELVSRNIKVEGIVISGITPKAAKEIAEVTHSFFNVISQMNKESDNQSAISVFKTVGAKYYDPPGTLSKGEDAVVNFLTSIGNPRNNFEIVEGSGLSRYNYVNSDLYVRLLKYMYDEDKTFDYFYSSLSIAGIDGTLRNRMIGTEAEKNIHAKTGTLNSVSSLCGYAVSRDNELLIFYISMNGFGSSANGVRYKQDQICEALCKFTRQ